MPVFLFGHVRQLSSVVNQGNCLVEQSRGGMDGWMNGWNWVERGQQASKHKKSSKFDPNLKGYTGFT